MIGVYMCNASKQPNSYSCVTHGMDKHASVCNTFLGIDIFPFVTHLLG